MAQRSATQVVNMPGAITVLASFNTMEGGLPIEVAADILSRLELFANGQVAIDQVGGKLYRTDVKAAATAKVITVQVVYKSTKDVSVFKDVCEKDAKEVIFAILESVLEDHDTLGNRALGKPEKSSDDKDKKDDKSGGGKDDKKDDQNGGNSGGQSRNRPRHRT